MHSYPIPLSLYNCYRAVRHEKRCIATPSLLLIAFLMHHCPVAIHRDGVCSLLFHLFFTRGDDADSDRPGRGETTGT